MDEGGISVSAFFSSSVAAVLKSRMYAQRAEVSTGPSGVSAGLPAGRSFLAPFEPEEPDFCCAERRCCASAGTAPAARLADASRAVRRESIRTRLLFDYDT